MKNWIKHRIKNWIQSKGYSLVRKYPSEVKYGKEYDLRYGIAEVIINSILRHKREAVVVQIGAFDGKSNDFLFDHLAKYPTRAIMVEPQPEAFKVLEKNYAQVPGVVFERAAIASEDGELPLYRIREEYHSSFRLAPQLASFDKKHLQNALSLDHLVGLPEDRDECIESIPVQGITMNTLLAKHSVTVMDILQIDTEGFDFEIIKMIDFEKIVPQLINFEIGHLSHDETDECMAFLAERDYMMMRYGINMLAMQKGNSSVEGNYYTSAALEV